MQKCFAGPYQDRKGYMADNVDKRGFSDEQRKEIADRVRQMVAQFESQALAAEAAKITVRQLKNYTNGESLPSLAAAANLAEATGHSLDWVMSGIQPERPATSDGELRPLDRALEVAKWRGRAIEQLRIQLPHMFGSIEGWCPDLEDDVGGAILALVENCPAMLGERDWVLSVAFEAQRIALAAVRGAPMPDYGPVE